MAQHLTVAYTPFLSPLTAILVLLPACGGGGDGPTDPNGDPPTINLSTVDLRVDEDQEHTTDVSGIVTNGTLQSVTVVEGSNVVEVSFDGGSLRITPAPDQNGSFRLEFTASNSDGTTSLQRSSSVQPWTDIPAGQLQDNETDTGAEGKMRLYDASDSTLIETISTDADGNYEAVQNVTEGDLIVQTALTNGGSLSSYTRTLRTEDGQDFEEAPMRAVPYPTQLVTKEELQEHILSVLDSYDFANLENLIRRYDPENFQGIYIAKTSPQKKEDGTPEGEFTTEEQQIIKQAWTDPENIPKALEGYTPNVVIGENNDQNPPYQITSSGGIQPEDGWIIVASDTVMQQVGIGISDDTDQNGKLDHGAVFLNNSYESMQNESTFRTITIHEGLHAIGGLGHSSISKGNSIMISLGKSPSPTYVDEKTGYLLLEETYPPLTPIEDIIALEWLGN